MSARTSSAAGPQMLLPELVDVEVGVVDVALEVLGLLVGDGVGLGDVLDVVVWLGVGLDVVVAVLDEVVDVVGISAPVPFMSVTILTVARLPVVALYELSCCSWVGLNPAGARRSITLGATPAIIAFGSPPPIFHCEALTATSRHLSIP